MTSTPAPSTGVPPIPATCAARPTIGGLVIPAINLPLADGGVDFRAVHQTTWQRAWIERRCQVCMRGLLPRAGDLAPSVVLLGRAKNLVDLVFVEPPLHGECAGYTSRACPMVAGRMPVFPDRPRLSEGPRGARCHLKGCGCAGWVGHHAPDGTPAGGHDPRSEVGSWYAVWIDDYTVVHHANREVYGGMVALDQVLRVREVSNPDEGRVWRTVPLDDVTAGYRPPSMSIVTT